MPFFVVHVRFGDASGQTTFSTSVVKQNRNGPEYVICSLVTYDRAIMWYQQVFLKFDNSYSAHFWYYKRRHSLSVY